MVIYVNYFSMTVLVAQLSPILCNSMNSSVLGIFQARVGWIAIPFSRGSF